MNNEYEKIKEILSENIKIPNNYNGFIESTLKELPNKKLNNIKHKNIKLVFATTCCSILLISSVVWAKDIGNFIQGVFSEFGLGDGVSIAVSNGYVGFSNEESNTQNVKILENNLIVDNINVKTNINKFIITDSEIGLDMNFEFESKINDYIDVVKTEDGNINYEDSYGINLSDLLIINEENKVIYCNMINKEVFYKFCKEHDLECSYSEYNDGKTGLIREYYSDINGSGVNFVYTLLSSNSNVFPNSKKLTIFFTRVILDNCDRESGKSHKIELQGDWKFSLEVPENMYNRTSESYEVISCENKDFNVYEAELTDTEFKIGIEIANIESPEEYERKLDEYVTNKGININDINEYPDEEYKKLYEEYWRKELPIGDNITLAIGLWEQHEKYECYVKNQNGEKFRLKNIGVDSFKEGNKYDYKAECEMSKYTATNEIEIVIVVYGKPYKIHLKHSD